MVLNGKKKKKNLEFLSKLVWRETLLCKNSMVEEPNGLGLLFGLYNGPSYECQKTPSLNPLLVY